MSTDKCHNRTALLKHIMDQNFSSSVRHEIMLLFKDIDPNRKEELAAKMLPLVKSSKTEQEALQKTTELIHRIVK